MPVHKEHKSVVFHQVLVQKSLGQRIGQRTDQRTGQKTFLQEISEKSRDFPLIIKGFPLIFQVAFAILKNKGTQKSFDPSSENPRTSQKTYFRGLQVMGFLSQL